MGTGKSKILLDTAAYIFDQGAISALLIIANKGSYANWVTDEIPIHLPDHIRRHVVLWQGTSTKKKQRALDALFQEQGMVLKILVMNIEALAHKSGEDMALRFVNAFPTLTVVDESTTIRNFKAKRTKAAFKVGRLSKVRRIMTGSVVDNRPLDAWAQFEFLDPGCLGFQSYYSFRNQYATMIDMTTRNSPRAFKVITGYRNVQDLHTRLSRLSFIIKKEDCLDLPKKVYQKYYVEMSDEQTKHYQQMKLLCMTEVDGELVSVKLALTQLAKFQQIVCGHVRDDEGNTHTIKNNRLTSLVNILNEVSGQAIVWCTYRHDIFAIEDALKKEFEKASMVTTYFGDTNTEARERVRRIFKRGNDTEGCRFLVANKTGAHGLNLTGATTHIFFSNYFDAEIRNQEEDRSHRIGQTSKVTYIDMVSKDTVDEKVLKVLRAKKNLSDEITVSNWKEFI